MRRLERNREINVQRQLEAERSRREQDIAHHMQEIRQRELRYVCGVAFSVCAQG